MFHFHELKLTVGAAAAAAAADITGYRKFNLLTL